MGCCIAGVLIASQGLTAFARVRAFLAAWIGLSRFRRSRVGIAALIAVNVLLFAVFFHELDSAYAHLGHVADAVKPIYAMIYEGGSEFPICRGTVSPDYASE